MLTAASRRSSVLALLQSVANAACPIAHPRALSCTPALPTPRCGDTSDDERWMEFARFIENLCGYAQAIADAGGREALRVGGLEQTTFDSRNRPELGSTAGGRSQGTNRPLRIQQTCWQEHGAGWARQQYRLQKVEPSLQGGGRTSRRIVQDIPATGKNKGARIHSGFGSSSQHFYSGAWAHQRGLSGSPLCSLQPEREVHTLQHIILFRNGEQGRGGSCYVHVGEHGQHSKSCTP